MFSMWLIKFETLHQKSQNQFGQSTGNVRCNSKNQASKQASKQAGGIERFRYIHFNVGGVADISRRYQLQIRAYSKQESERASERATRTDRRTNETLTARPTRLKFQKQLVKCQLTERDETLQRDRENKRQRIQVRIRCCTYKIQTRQIQIDRKLLRTHNVKKSFIYLPLMYNFNFSNFR